MICRHHLAAYLEDLLTRIHDLLVLHSPDNGLKQYLSPDDQLFIYETAGILIVHSQFSPEVNLCCPVYKVLNWKS